MKLIDQCRTKQVLDYVKQHSPKTDQDNVNTSSKKGRKNQRTSECSEDNTAALEYKYKIKVLHAKEDCAVIVSKKVDTIRKHIICCVVQDIAFDETSFKKFIQIQNKIHDTICCKRNNATLATHDFKKLVRIFCVCNMYKGKPKDNRIQFSNLLEFICNNLISSANFS